MHRLTLALDPALRDCLCTHAQLLHMKVASFARLLLVEALSARGLLEVAPPPPRRSRARGDDDGRTRRSSRTSKTRRKRPALS
jgi:hypothetical protein